MFPIATLTDVVQAFHRKFSTTPLRMYIEETGAVVQPLLDGRCRSSARKIKGTVSRAAMSKHVQLVLSDRSSLTAGREVGVMSPQA